MSLGLTHFAIGAAGMLLLQPLLGPSVRFPRTLVVASGLWALVPDLHYVIPNFPDVFVGQRAVFGNVFWFHIYLDGVVQGRGIQRNAALALALITVAAIVGDSGLLDRRRWTSGGSASGSRSAENRHAESRRAENRHVESSRAEKQHAEGRRAEDRPAETRRTEHRRAESASDGRTVPSGGDR